MSLGRISFNPIWVFYRGTETLDRLSQLKGKRIGLGLAIRVTPKSSPQTASILIMQPC